MKNSELIKEHFERINESDKTTSRKFNYLEIAQEILKNEGDDGIDIIIDDLAEDESFLETTLNVTVDDIIHDDGTGRGLLDPGNSGLYSYFEDRFFEHRAFWNGLFRDFTKTKTEPEVVTPETEESIIEYIEVDEPRFLSKIDTAFVDCVSEDHLDPLFANVDKSDSEDFDSFEFMLPTIIARKTDGDLKAYLTKVKTYFESLKKEEVQGLAESSLHNTRYLLFNAAVSWFERDKDIYCLLRDILGTF